MTTFLSDDSQLININHVYEIYINHYKNTIDVAYHGYNNVSPHAWCDLRKTIAGPFITKQHLMNEWEKICNNDPKYFVTLGKTEDQTEFFKKQIDLLKEMILCRPGGSICMEPFEEFTAQTNKEIKSDPGC